jgi:tetratricopeptide (TPR) repeat protein
VVQDLVGRVLMDLPAPVAVLGAPGVGKTTVTTAMLHQRRVRRRFHSRRYFVRCDGATNFGALLRGIASSVGVLVGDDLTQRVFAALGGGPTLLVLDNAETPWEGSDQVLVEELLSQLAAIEGCSLVASLRGSERPGHVPWSDPAIEVGPLTKDAAEALFLAIAPDFARDPELAFLLGPLEGIPLCLELLAHAAQGEPSLDGLRRRWVEERTDLLRRGPGDHRLLSLNVSLQISIYGPRVTETGRRVLSLLGLLPDGIACDDLDEVLLSRLGSRGASELRKTRLAHDASRRLRTLAPIREYVRLHLPPSPEDIEAAAAHYAGLAQDLAPKVGGQGGGDASTRLAHDAANIEETIKIGLSADGEIATSAVRAATAFAGFMRLSGAGALDLLQTAVAVADASGDPALEANAVASLGNVAFARSDYETARNAYEQGLTLYEQTGDMLGQANCIKGLGDIAFRRTDDRTARNAYEEALPFYDEVGDIVGQANCIRSLGDIAFRHTDDRAARDAYDRALPLYAQVGDIRGQAQCIKGLGDVGLRSSDQDAARNAYERALPLYEQVGDVLGQANCIKGLGNIVARSDQEAARSAYRQALPLYERVGDVLGQANCILSLGEIALRRTDHEAAKNAFEQALALYEINGAVLGQAGCIRDLGELALLRSDHEAAAEAYERALALYERADSAQGQANCIKGLGNIALARSDLEAATEAYERALALYSGFGDIVGQANCIKGLGDIAFARTEHKAAREAYERALSGFVEDGSILGQANCVKGLGDIAFACSDYTTARKAYEEALPLYQRVGSVRGQGDCTLALGDIALARSDHRAARKVYEQALHLYEAIPEPCSIGQAQLRLARQSFGSQRTDRVRAARAAWTSIRREDLIAQLDEEFPPP